MEDRNLTRDICALRRVYHVVSCIYVEEEIEMALSCDLTNCMAVLLGDLYEGYLNSIIGIHT